MDCKATVFAACFFLACPPPAQAESIAEIINQFKVEYQNSCTRPEGGIDKLVAATLSTQDPTEQALGLQFLAQQPQWQTDNQEEALIQLRALGGQNESVALLVSRALETAKGGLRDAAIIYRNDPAGYEAYLREIEADAGNENKFYRALARVTLAEFLQDQVFAKTVDTPLPLPSSDSDSLNKLKQAIELYEDQKDFYRKESTVSELFSRDFSLDFEYQIALLQFAIGDEKWRETLQSIVDTEGTKDIYDRASETRHIYVHSFLRPPLRPEVVQATADDFSNTNCGQRASGDNTEIRYSSAGIVERFYNASQLALFTCARLTGSEQQMTVDDLASSLSEFVNHDYRVILGHYRGDKVRFSYATKQETQTFAEKMQSALADSFSPKSQLEVQLTGSSCTVPASYLNLKVSTEVGDQSDGTDRGYYYIGEGLSFEDAQRLLSAIQLDENFENAYLLRPKIE